MCHRFRSLLVALIVVIWLGPAPAASAREPDPDDYERVLIPVFFFGEGAHGSRWETRAVVYNDGRDSVVLARNALNGDPVCDAICGCGSRGEVLPDETNEICRGLSSFAGVLIYPRKDQADSLFYELVVRDRSRDSSSAGAEVPVVRERDLREKIVLLDVPVGGKFRTALRVFDSGGRGGVEARIQVFAADGTEPLYDAPITLIQPVLYFAPEPFPMNPAIAFIPDLLSYLPAPEDGPEGMDGRSETRRLRIELTPIKPLERFWAFASVTNDETQEVTMITP